MELKRLGATELEKVGENIRVERENQGIRQIDLADEIGIGRSVIYKIENGKGSLSVEYLYYISQILGKPMDFFMSTEKTEQQNEKSDKNCPDVDEIKKRFSDLIEGRSVRELCMIERVITAFFEEGD